MADVSRQQSQGNRLHGSNYLKLTDLTMFLGVSRDTPERWAKDPSLQPHIKHIWLHDAHRVLRLRPIVQVHHLAEFLKYTRQPDNPALSEYARDLIADFIDLFWMQ